VVRARRSLSTCFNGVLSIALSDSPIVAVPHSCFCSFPQVWSGSEPSLPVPKIDRPAFAKGTKPFPCASKIVTHTTPNLTSPRTITGVRTAVQSAGIVLYRKAKFPRLQQSSALRASSDGYICGHQQTSPLNVQLLSNQFSATVRPRKLAAINSQPTGKPSSQRRAAETGQCWAFE